MESEGKGLHEELFPVFYLRKLALDLEFDKLSKELFENIYLLLIFSIEDSRVR